MSAKAEEFAVQLLEKTENGKLKWNFVEDQDWEIYKTDADGEIAFWIKRKLFGERKVFVFELRELDRVVLSDREGNLQDSQTVSEGRIWDAVFDALGGSRPSIQPIDTNRVKRFRLYSDLYSAARKATSGGNHVIEKAQEFLARLA